MSPELIKQQPTISQSNEQELKTSLLSGEQEMERLSVQYNIPKEDVLLIALNASGIKCGDIVNDRGRFVATFPSGRSYLLALTISHQPFSPFEHKYGQVIFDGKPVAQATPIEKDTCHDSYWRGGKKHLTLNSNSRSKCRGCSFCGTYSLENDDEALTNPNALRKKAKLLLTDLGHDFSTLESVGIVTGCFPNEKSVVNHLIMVRQVFSEFNFRGEIRYIGSQLRSDEALQKVVSSGPFALYLTIETFGRREKLMKKSKASLSLERGRRVLATAKKMGAETSFLYIAGLDEHKTMEREFPLYAPLLTRLPQIQIFQVYTPDQIKLRHPDAARVEYFLKNRQIAEQAYPDLRPIAANNFRSLWYTKYGQYLLPNEEI